MDDEQKQIKAVGRGVKAKVTLENESIKEAFNYLEAEYIKRWKECKEPEGRDRLWQATQVLEKVKEHLALAIVNGGVARKFLDQIESERRTAA